MKMNKKAVELTLQTIIIAAILLTVMAVVIFIFVGGMNDQRSIFKNQADQVNDSINDPNNDSSFVNQLIKGSFILPIYILSRKRKISTFT